MILGSLNTNTSLSFTAREDGEVILTAGSNLSLLHVSLFDWSIGFLKQNENFIFEISIQQFGPIFAETEQAISKLYGFTSVSIKA